MLNQQQSDLLKVIFSGESLFGSLPENNVKSQGLEIYRYSLIANAARALSITFATVHSYMGKKAFSALVELYLKAELKHEYDWGEFGSTFPHFISTQPIEHADLFSQLAKLDLLCHESERSKDVNTDLTTLNLLSEYDAYELYITLSSGIRLMQSTLPLDEINNTITQLTEEQKITKLDDVTQFITEFSSEYIDANKGDDLIYYFVIWRPDFQAQYTRITTEEYQWFNILLNTKNKENISIGEALDTIKNEDFSFVDWLPKVIKEQIINGLTASTLLNK